MQSKLGMKSDESVLLLLQNDTQFIVSYHAILDAGGFVFPGNPILKKVAVAFIQNDTTA